MKRYFKPNVDPYYNYMLFYVDELLHIGFKPKEDMYALNMIYRLRGGFGPPDRYLGANDEKLQLKYVRVVWSTNRVDYLKRAIEIFDNSLGVDNMAINNYVYGHGPYSSSFRPELYVTEEMGEELTDRYQQLIEALI